MKNQIKKINIMETAPVIKKVEMLSDGREGLKVTYVTSEVRNGVGSQSEYIKKQHRPVQKEFHVYFSQLKEHLLNLTGYLTTEKTKPLFEENITVTSVLRIKRSEHNVKFQIGGTNKVLGDYSIVLNSPLVHSDSYDESDELAKIFENVFEETKKFMSGEKGADSRQVSIDYLFVKKDIYNAENKFDKMSKEEQDVIMKEANQFFGLTIVEENEERVITCEEEEEQEIIEKAKPEEQENKKTEKEEDEIPAFEPVDDENFELPTI